MGSLVRIGVASYLSLLLLTCSLGRHPAQSASVTPPRTLFSQSAVEVLERDFSGRSVSYLLFDANSGALLASHWEHYDDPIPLGSLVKPFTALAYAEAHEFRYPTYECKGQSSGCWQVHPHGKLDIVSAISVSCNSYFLSLSESVTAEQLLPVTRAFELESPEPDFTRSSLIGLGERWKISPIRMARAYLELYRRRTQPGVREILAGMLQSEKRGTGAAVGRALKHSDAFVKTGTAPCTHASRAPADGSVIALVPAQKPEILLMIRVHGVAGAKAAETAGRMLSRMEE
ncbi:MAG TPA: penicillin-binding transpeptidase domain-containing protein [Candidatus Acidoferrum sp.]|jgi:cell division protein FtsI/penicillin-binding protein 2